MNHMQGGVSAIRSFSICSQSSGSPILLAWLTLVLMGHATLRRNVGREEGHCQGHVLEGLECAAHSPEVTQLITWGWER